jgi:hypothetical protein
MGEVVVKHFIAALAAVGLAVLGFTPTAGAVGYGACTIVGTISFSPQTPGTGTWAIGPATLDCQGIVGKRARITGRGPLTGSGEYKALAPGACLPQQGTGKVEYAIPTASGVIKVSEAASDTTAGAGVFETPTLHGTFQMAPPYNGDCVTKPLSRATFVAQVVLYRYAREFPPGGPPGPG